MRTLEISEVTAEIIQKSLNGSEPSTKKIIEIITKYSNYIVRVRLKYISQEDRQDVSQDIILKIYNSLHRFDPKKGWKFSTWVSAIAKNHIIDEQRKKGRYINVSINSDEEGCFLQELEDKTILPDETLHKQESTKFVAQLLSSNFLTDEQKTIIKMYIIDDLKYQEIEKKTGIKINRIKLNMRKIKDKILNNKKLSKEILMHIQNFAK